MAPLSLSSASFLGSVPHTQASLQEAHLPPGCGSRPGWVFHIRKVPSWLWWPRRGGDLSEHVNLSPLCLDRRNLFLNSKDLLFLVRGS